MRASEFLAMTSQPVFCDSYTGVSLEIDRKLYPVTNIVKRDDKLVLLHDKDLPTLTMSDFYKALMLNKKAQLYYETDELNIVFGFKEKDSKIVI